MPASHTIVLSPFRMCVAASTRLIRATYLRLLEGFAGVAGSCEICEQKMRIRRGSRHTFGRIVERGKLDAV